MMAGDVFLLSFRSVGVVVPFEGFNFIGDEFFDLVLYTLFNFDFVEPV